MGIDRKKYKTRTRSTNFEFYIVTKILKLGEEIDQKTNETERLTEEITKLEQEKLTLNSTLSTKISKLGEEIVQKQNETEKLTEKITNLEQEALTLNSTL